MVEAGFNVVGIVTAPDKPAGRGLQPQESAVKKFAVSKSIPVLQPERMKDEGFLKELRAWKADIQIVIAFRMMPEVVWNMPPMGTFNLHASLLPRYRGAAPINRAIMNGETETGLTTFFLKHEIDTGNIILQEKLNIGDRETAGELHDRMMILGAQLVVKTLQVIQEGKYTLNEQHPEPGMPHAPKIFREDMRIQWNRPVKEIYNQIRGLSPYPAAFTEYESTPVKIYKSFMEQVAVSANPGTFICTKDQMKVACADGYIYIEEIQVQGKKRMDIKSFLIGFRVTEGAFR